MSRNLSTVLNESLTPTQLDLIQCVAEEATLQGFPLYIVGGLVRDLMLGRASFDFDLVVEGDAPSLAHGLEKKYGGNVTIHSKFGTAKWDIRGSKIKNRKPFARFDPRLTAFNLLDLVSARSETYKHPGSLPTVKMGKIEDDLRRRDFTINALAIRMDGPHFGELRDDFGGMVDIQQGLIRVLHQHSFVDDPTRMYRAVRYEKRLGFKIDDETVKLIPEARALVDKLSAQRVRHELDLILDEPNASAILGRLAELDLLKPVHAALPWDESIKGRFQAGCPTETSDRVNLHVIEGRDENRLMGWLFWLLALSDKQIESLNKRLHFTAPHLKTFLAASRLFAALSKLIEWKPSKCVEYLDELPLSSIYGVYLAMPEGNLKFPLEQYLTVWRHVKPKTTGNDLKRLGLPPGPDYHRILQKLRNAWLDREIHDEQEEKRYLEEILHRS